MQNIRQSDAPLFLSSMKILIVEDELNIARMVQTLMESEGYTCLTASDGLQGLQAFKFHNPDLVILDWNLPGMNGIDVCNRIRQAGIADPYILMLTSRQAADDRVDGFSSGVDDYMSKPFQAKELTVRVRALLRRQLRRVDQEKSASIIETPHLRIDSELLAIYIRSTVEDEFKLLKEELSALTFKLLLTLARRPGRVWSRDNLINAVWEEDFNGGDRVVDAHIKKLRAKLKVCPGDLSDKFIKTKIGLGYFFQDIPSC